MKYLAAALALFTGLVVWGGTSSAHAAEIDDPIRDIGACMASGKPADILVVMDRSASLAKTDPKNARVTAAQYLVERLVDVAKRGKLDLSVAVAGFDVGFDVTKPWTKATPANEKAVTRHLDTYRTANTGWETDYWEAVQGARSALADRAKGQSHCQAWVWFSDGSYELDFRDSSTEQSQYGKTKPYANGDVTSKSAAVKARKAGISDLCRDGGQADQLRVQGVVTLAVGLKAPGADADFGLMKGIAEGKGGPSGAACQSYDGTTPGVFTEVSQIDGLLFAFDEFSSAEQKPITQTSKLCPKKVCSEEAHEFVLDNSIGSVHILATSNIRTAKVALTHEGLAKPIVLARGRSKATSGGITISSKWLSDRSVEIDMSHTGTTGWAGVWSLVTVDPDATKAAGTAKSRILLSGDVEPDWPKASSTLLHTGEKLDLAFGLRRRGGAALSPGDIEGEASLSAQLIRPGEAALTIADRLVGDDLAKPQPVDLSHVAIGGGVVRVTLDLTTKSAKAADGTTVAGTQLESQSKDFPVEIRPPANYPRVPTSLNLGKIEKLATVEGRLKVDGPGCVWFAGKNTSTTLPVGVGKPVVTSTARTKVSCIKAAAGASSALPLSFSFDDLNNGAATGTLVVMTAPREGTESPIPVTVKYQLEMQKPRDAAVFWLTLVLVTLAGLLIPLALLYLAKWVAARIPGSSLLVARIPGTVDADGYFRAVSGLEVAVNPTEMESVALAVTNRREVTLPGGGELRARMGLNPGAPGHVDVVVPGSWAASTGSRGTTKAGAAIVPSAVAGSWVVALTHAGSDAPSELILFTNSRADGLDELVSDARSTLPDVVATLRAKMPVPPVGGGEGGPADPWSGGATSGGDDWSGGGGSSPTRPPTSSPGPAAGATSSGGQSGSDGWSSW